MVEKGAHYELAPYVDVTLFQPGDDLYKLVTRQYVHDAKELKTLLGTRAPELRLERSESSTPATIVTPQTEPETRITREEVAPPLERTGEDQRVDFAAAESWKVWEMIFALLHSMQKHPDQYEALRNLAPDSEELIKKLNTEGPKLVQEFIHLATRGEMNFDDETKMWAVLDQTKLTNMDVKVGLLVLQKAGFNVKIKPEYFQLVAPGTEASAKPFVLQFDTIDTAKRKRLEEKAQREHTDVPGMHVETSTTEGTDLKEGEYRITVDHHTDNPKERKTSGAQLLYDYLSAAGLLTAEKLPEKDAETLHRLLAFVNDHDNGRFPTNQEFYRRSARTLWGIASDSRVSAEVIFGIMQRGRGPEDPLTDEDLNEVIFGTKKVEKEGVVTKEPLTVRDLIEGYPGTSAGPGLRGKEAQNEFDAESFDRWRDLGYVIPTDYGPLYVCLDIPGRYMPKQITARAWGGVPNVLIWSPNKHSFFLALGGGKTFDPHVLFPQEGTEIIRGHMAIFKRQIKSPAELTATMQEILGVLSKKRTRFLKGDLYDYVEKNITPDSSLETLFSIYTTAPEKQQSVVDMLVNQWPPNVLDTIHHAVLESKSKQDKNVYEEIETRVKNGRLARAPKALSQPPPPPRPVPTFPTSSSRKAETRPVMSADEMMAVLGGHTTDDTGDENEKGEELAGAKSTTPTMSLDEIMNVLGEDEKDEKREDAKGHEERQVESAPQEDIIPGLPPVEIKKRRIKKKGGRPEGGVEDDDGITPKERVGKQKRGGVLRSKRYPDEEEGEGEQE